MSNANLEITYGRITPTEAIVYIRSFGAGAYPPIQITGGEIVGPQCRYTSTLTASSPIRLLDAGENGEVQQTRVIIPDPSLWTPSLPLVYRVRIEFGDDQAGESCQEVDIALRQFGAKGKDFWLDGNRWVMRGVERSQMEPSALSSLRETGTVIVIAEPDLSFFEEAEQEGLLAMLDLRQEDKIPDWIKENRLRWPAIPLTLVGRSFPMEEARALLPNTLILQYLEEDESAEASEADAFCCQSDHPAIASGSWASWEKPLIVCRPREERSEDMFAARRRCDLLQRDCVPFGQFAGYIV